MVNTTSSSSKSAIAAGILAGLLAAGLGAYYLHLHQPPAAVQAPRTKQQASLALLALPELRAWSAHIAEASGGQARGAVIEDDPAPRLVGGKRYWQFSFVENGALATHRLESFLVAEQGDEILVEDVASDELLTLQRWRQEKRPQARFGGL